MVKTKGILLEELTWRRAEEVLRPEAVVVIPIGAACKEHGPHLKLADWKPVSVPAADTSILNS